MKLAWMLSVLLILISCNQHQSEPFEGKIGKRYKDSKEWWPPLNKPKKGSPNVLLILLDDVGFAQIGSFGGLVETETIDKLASNGLRFNNFHTTALCSPSRASIMAGRNPHRIGLGSHSLTAMGFPGYNAQSPHSAKSVAATFQKSGYTTYAIGKWDHTPLWEVSQQGPFDRWATGEGFDHFYGFMAADADNYRTLLYSGNTPIEPWRNKKNYHLSEDLADKAIEWITGHKSIDPSRPFMMFWAPVAQHAPHQAPKDYIKKYKGKFDMGWDKAREMILAKQKKLGIVPGNTGLTQRVDAIPAWETLNAKQRRMYSKQMEVFAAMLDHVDDQIGRIVATLKRIGEYDNTLIMLSSDNGASGEGGLAGTFNETYVLNGLQTAFEANERHLADWGGPSTYPHYHAGWAMAGNTPFRYFKQAVHRGGIQDFLVVHHPNGIKSKGEIRNQYAHITDIAPTMLASAGLETAKEIDGVVQMPLDGIALNYAFDDKDAEEKHDTQYYEMFGNRSIYHKGWKAVTLHANRMPWELNVTLDFDKDVWELYNIKEDFSESVNLADKYPEKLKELKKLFEKEAWKNNVYPLYDDMIMRMARQSKRMFGDRKEFVYYAPGAIRIAEKAAPPTKGNSHSIETTIDYTGREKGVIVSLGGFTGGFSMFLKDGRLHYDYNYLDGVFYHLKSPRLKRGKRNLKFVFKAKDHTSGTGHLYVDDVKVGTVDMPTTHVSTFSLSETFDVGMDSGTQVSKHYKGHNPYIGPLDKVTVRLIDL